MNIIVITLVIIIKLIIIRRMITLTVSRRVIISVCYRFFVWGGKHKQTTREDQSTNGKFRIRVLPRLTEGNEPTHLRGQRVLPVA